MAINIDEKVDFKIKVGDKISVYPLIVSMDLTPEQEEEFEAIKVKLEEEHSAIKDAADKVAEITKKIKRESEDIEDITLELQDMELDNKEHKKLLKSRRKARSKIRELEDERDELRKNYDQSDYEKSAKELIETIAKESFRMHVKEDEKSEALINAIKTKNIKYSTVVSELNRLIADAKKKKK